MSLTPRQQDLLELFERALACYNTTRRPLDVANELLDAGLPTCDVLVFEGRTTLLEKLISLGADAGMVRRAIEGGADVNRHGPMDVSPLAAAVRRGSEATVRVLLAAGALPRICRVPVLVEMPDHLLHMIDELVGLGAHPDLLHPLLNCTALHHAVWCGNFALARALLEVGANVHVEGPGKRETLMETVDGMAEFPQHAADCEPLYAASDAGEGGRLARVWAHRCRWAWSRRRAVVMGLELPESP